MKHVYLMPGMAASKLIFENIKLPADQFELHFMDWLIPQSNESISQYAADLTQQIVHERPILIGVSFGGIIVQEIAKLIDVEKVIIISSVKSHHEFPRRMRYSRRFTVYKYLPTGLLRYFDQLSNFGSGIAPKKVKLYQRYLHIKNPIYIDWALDAIIQWRQEYPPAGIIHIHGDKDPVFPIKYIDDCIKITGGTHVMIINRFKWFNENLPQIIMQS